MGKILYMCIWILMCNGSYGFFDQAELERRRRITATTTDNTGAETGVAYVRLFREL